MLRPRQLTLGLALGSSILVWMMAGCGAVQHPVPAPIKLGTYLWPGSFWIDVAWQKGWFAQAGLEVERVSVHRQYFAALDAAAAGRLDVVGFSQFDLVRHVAAGDDLVGIAALDFSAGAEALIARPGFAHLADLKGRRVALERGTYMEYLLSVAADRDGIDVADVTLVDRTQDNALADFLAGRVDAIMVWEPYVSKALAAGGTALFSTADYPGLTYTILTLRRDFIKMHPAQVTALMAVWHRAERYVQEHPEESSEIVARLFDEPLPSVRNLMRRVRVLGVADNQRAFSYAAGFESLHSSWRRMDDFMISRGVSRAPAPSPEHLSSRFIAPIEQAVEQ